MKKAERIALITMLALLAAFLALTGTAIYSGVSLDKKWINAALFAGAAAALGQMVLAALALWGLRLTRQNYELTHVPGEETKAEGTSMSALDSGFRMSYSDDTVEAPKARKTSPKVRLDADVEIRTLETGFQRVVIALSAVFLLLLAVATWYMMRWESEPFRKDPGKGFHIAKIDPLVVTAVVGVAGAYIALFSMARVRRGMEGFGEAVSGLLTLAVPGAVAVAVGCLLSWVGVRYATEFAAWVVILILVIQALELLVNALRSYDAVEELDQEPLDLQATPLVPMLSSVWINGMRMLMSQSMGMSTDRGVIARMMPRVIVAAIALAVLSSMFHVVPAGNKAVLERFGHVQGYDKGPAGIEANMLSPGLHVTLPWPIDQLVLIPDKQLQRVTVGAELEFGEEFKEFEFWNWPHEKENEDGRFITGDLSLQDDNEHQPRQLESFGTVWWRVKDPGKYYMALSHSEWFETVGHENEGTTEAHPMNELMVARIANHAMTQAFAEMKADRAMVTGGPAQDAIAKWWLQKEVTGRPALESRAKYLMEQDLAKLDAGIEIVSFSINDVHPPYGKPDERTGDFGPAGAFEDVVAAIQDRSRIVYEAQAYKYEKEFKAASSRDEVIRDAKVYANSRVYGAKGDSKFQLGTIKGYEQYPFAAEYRLRYNNLLNSLGDSQKMIIGPGVEPPILLPESKGPIPVPAP